MLSQCTVVTLSTATHTLHARSSANCAYTNFQPLGCLRGILMSVCWPPWHTRHPRCLRGILRAYMRTNNLLDRPKRAPDAHIRTYSLQRSRRWLPTHARQTRRRWLSNPCAPDDLRTCNL